MSDKTKKKMLLLKILSLCSYKAPKKLYQSTNMYTNTPIISTLRGGGTRRKARCRRVSAFVVITVREKGVSDRLLPPGS